MGTQVLAQYPTFIIPARGCLCVRVLLRAPNYPSVIGEALKRKQFLLFFFLFSSFYSF